MREKKRSVNGLSFSVLAIGANRLLKEHRTSPAFVESAWAAFAVSDTLYVMSTFKNHIYFMVVQASPNMSKTDYNIFRQAVGRVHGMKGSKTNYMDASGIQIISLPTFDTIRNLEKTFDFPRAVPVLSSNSSTVIGGAVDNVQALIDTLIRQLSNCQIVDMTKTCLAGGRWVLACSIDGTGIPYPFVKITVHVLNFVAVRFSVLGSVVVAILNIKGIHFLFILFK